MAGKIKPMPVGLKYPRLWRHKKSKQEMRVMPWWEIPDPVLDTETSEDLLEAGVPIKFGALVQVGYLMENEHGVWFGFGPSVQGSFKDLGEWKEKKK